MEKLIEKLREKTGDPKGDFPNIILPTSEKVYALPFVYKKKSKNGGFEKEDSFIKIQMQYNPFNGKKLNVKK